MTQFESFKKNGFCIGSKVISEKEIVFLRKSLNRIFSLKGNPKEINLFDIEDDETVNLIYKIYASDNIKNFFIDLSKFYDHKINLIPRFIIQRNYHVDRKNSPGVGWHRDCAGELLKKYCKDKISNQSYIFGKMGIYLQHNSEYGGSIDLIPNSHRILISKNFIYRKLKSLKLFLITKFQKFLPLIYTKLPEKIFMETLNAKRLYPEPGSLVLWDSRIIHRGSPIDDKNKFQASFKPKEFFAEVPKEVTKFSLYVDFGNNFAFDSYMYDRNNRDLQKKETEFLNRNLSHLQKHSPNLYSVINSHISPTIKKYQ